MKLVTGSEMRDIDRTAIDEFGIPGIVLMENAGRETAELIAASMPELARGSHVGIFCGPGNNGGDGLVIARYLARKGVRITVYILTHPDKLKGDAAANCSIAERLSIPVIPILNEEEWTVHRDKIGERSVLFVDAIFGTGLRKEVTGIAAAVIEWLNRTDRPIWSVDIPSGLDADTGRTLGVAVKASHTVTFAFPKVGHIVHPGPEFTGNLHVRDIGIPDEALNINHIKRELLDKKLCASWLLPRPLDSHKGTYGHALVLAGSPGKTGAAVLTCLGALRSGAGLVTVGMAKSLNTVFENKLTEAMSESLPETVDSTLSAAAFDRISEIVQDKKALAIGPGISLHPETQDLIRRLVAEIEIPMVIDADALKALKGHLHLFKEGDERVRILTPHPGEMAAILGKKSWSVQEHRLSLAEEFAEEYGVYLVLKGAATVIAGPQGKTALNRTGGPALSCGGTGDVLTGMIAGFLAQGYDPFRAASLGVFCHGATGDRLSAGHKTSGILATEIADAVPGVLADLRRLHGAG
ncbi:MAG: NAD(P)H-hydrate dehydratase [Pseudomonadota bacterium]